MVFPVEHHAHSGSSCGPKGGELEGKGKAGSEGGADSGGELALFEIDLNEER